MFNSIEEIRERFQITAVERQDIRGSLLRILAGVHPDKNGGTFKNDSDRELYNSASAAVEFSSPQRACVAHRIPPVSA